MENAAALKNEKIKVERVRKKGKKNSFKKKTKKDKKRQKTDRPLRNRTRNPNFSEVFP